MDMGVFNGRRGGCTVCDEGFHDVEKKMFPFTDISANQVVEDRFFQVGICQG